MRRLLGAVAVAVAVAGVAVWLTADRLPPPPAPPVDGTLPPGAVARIGGWEFTPITSNAGLSTDGTQVIGGSSDGWVRFFDVETGREVRRFPAHDDVSVDPNRESRLHAWMNGRFRPRGDDSGPGPDGVRRLAVSGDGTRIATAGAHVVRVFRAADGTRIAEWPYTMPTDLTWLPDGRRVAVSCGTQIDRFDAEAPGDPATRVTPSISGGGPRRVQVARLVSIAGTADAVTVVDLDNGGGTTRGPVLHRAEIRGPVAFRRDASLSAGIDSVTGHVVLRDPAFHSVRWIEVPGPPTNALPRVLEWTPDGTRLLVETAEGVVVLDEGGEERARVAVEGVETVAFSADGRRALVETTAGLRVFDTTTWTPVGKAADRRRWSVPAFSGDGRALVTPGPGASLVFHAVRTGAFVRKVEVAAHPGTRPHLLRRTGLVATIETPGVVRLHDMEDGRVVMEGVRPVWPTAARRADGTVVVFDPETKRIRTEAGSATIADALLATGNWGLLSADAERLFLPVGNDLFVVDTRTGATVATVPTGPLSQGDVDVCRDGSVVAFVRAGGRVEVRDVASGRVVFDESTRSDSDDLGWGLSLAPDGARLAVVRPPYDRVEVVDLASGATAASFGGAPTRFTWVEWSPAGDLIASSHEDGTILVWDVAAATRR